MSAIRPEVEPPALPIAAGPQSLKLATSAPRTYRLDRRLPLLHHSALPILQPTLATHPRPTDASLTGTATVWPFPGPLRARARAGATTPYDVMPADRGSDTCVPPDILENVTWATLIDVRLRRLAGIAHQYALQGTDAGDRELLTDLQHHLATTGGQDTVARLLIARADSADGTTCLDELATDPSLTFIVKTRATAGMASENPIGRLVDAFEPDSCCASLDELAPWLRLLCEARAVGGQGYCFGFTGSDGGDLPASALDADGGVTLTLLVIVGDQQASALATGRTLLPFNNAALVGPGLDATTTALDLEAADESDTALIARVPPGHVGFSLMLPASGSLTRQAQLQALLSKATCQWVAAPAETPVFAIQPGPVSCDGLGLHARRRARNDRWRRAGRTVAAEPDGGCWRHDQVVAVARFGPPSRAPAVPGLPDPEQDPYRGVGSSVVIRLDFSDPPGDAIAAPQPAAGTLTLPVGYTDPLGAVADWPGVATGFTLQPAQGGAQLRITVAAQPSLLQPCPGQAHDDFTDGARRLAERFAAIHFQLAQPELSLSVVTSLRQGGRGDPEPVALEGLEPLRAFVAATFVAARAAAALQPVRPFAAAPGTLDSVRDLYGPDWAELAQANAATPIAALLGAQAVTVPLHVDFAAADTADGLVARAPAHWPALTAAALLMRNAELPLRAGAVLARPAAVVPVTGSESLDALAAQHHTTAALLAGDCRQTPGVLRHGFVFKMGDVAVTVGATPAGQTQPVGTLEEVCQAFAALGVSDGLDAIAARNGAQDGMFMPGAQLTTLHYVSRAAGAGSAADSLSCNASGASATELAALNGKNAGLFDAGASLGWGSMQSPVPAAGDPCSLHDFALRHGITAAQLLQANAALRVPAGSPLQVPATASLPADAAQVRVPYTVQADDSLARVAALFLPAAGGTDAALRLAAANLAMPGTLAAGTITVAGVQVTARAGDSLGGVLAQLQARSSTITLADLVAAIGDASDHLAPGALLICPPALLPGNTPLTPAEVADLYGLDAVAFAQANAGVPGLVAPGLLLQLSHHDTPQGRLTTRDRDTLNSLVWRFAAQGVVISLAELVEDLQGRAFLKAGAMALLPPTAVVLDTATAVGAGPFPSAAFRLSVALRLQRPGDAVDPAFRTGRGDGPVERSESFIPASSTAPAGAALHEHLPWLRLATGRAADAGTELWAVNFGTGGITQVSAAPGVTAPDGKATQPRVFALRPLYAAPVSMSAEIQSLQDDGGLSAMATAISFEDVDPEPWAQRFLADVDLFLSAACVDAIYRNKAARASLDDVLGAKATLSSGIAAGLSAVLALEDPRAAAGQAEARSIMEQALGEQLSRAYAVSAALQYDTTVQSPWTSPGGHGARLQGSVGTAATEVRSAPACTPATGSIRLDTSPSFLTLLVAADAAARDSSAHLDLQYECSDLEFEADKGHALQRIGFSPALKGALWPASTQVALGAAEVPLPRRTLPALPVLLGQRTVPSFALPATPEEASRWTYELSYACEHAAQDEVHVEVNFNAPRLTHQLGPRHATGSDLASALARYMAVADPLWARLGGLADPSTRPDEATLARLAQTFAKQVVAVAKAWDKHWEHAGGFSGHARSSAHAAPPQPQRLSYRVRLTAARPADAAAPPAALVLTRLEAPAALDLWPDVSVIQPDGEAMLLTADKPVGDTRTYPLGVASSLLPGIVPQLRFAWTGLSLPVLECAQASLSVQRNPRLLGEQGPDTQDGFLLRTPDLEAQQSMAPLNIWQAPLDISALGDTVAQALAAVFTALAPPGQEHGPWLGSLAARCQYALAPPDAARPALQTSVPVFLGHELPLAEATAQAAAQALANWQRQQQSLGSPAQWAFTLMLNATVDAVKPRPLLVLEMVYAMTA